MSLSNTPSSYVNKYVDPEGESGLDTTTYTFNGSSKRMAWQTDLVPDLMEWRNQVSTLYGRIPSNQPKTSAFSVPCTPLSIVNYYLITTTVHYALVQ